MLNTENKVSIRVNAINRLKKIRAGLVYDSITTVMDELLQNCQRSFSVSNIKHPVIDIIAENDTLIIRDNGDGCSNPQSIFEFETSGWNIEDAFGQGGSESVFQIADYINIRSQDWVVSVNVFEMIEKEDLYADVTFTEEYFHGYEITLKGTKIQDNLITLIEYLRSVTQYFDYDVYINGELVERKDLHDFKAVYKETFTGKLYKATLSVQKGYRNIDIYYEKRKVCDLWFPGVYGVVELARGAVNLKAPDRKSIIYDEKRSKFYESLKEDCKLLYLGFVSQATESEFDEFQYGIEQNLTPADYADYLPCYDLNNPHRIAMLKEEVASEDTVYEKQKLECTTAYNDGTSLYLPESMGVKKQYIPAKKSPRTKGEFRSKLGKILNIAWCDLSKKDSLQEMINTAENVGIKVIYAKNNLYAKAFQYWGIPYLEDIMEVSKARYIVRNTRGKNYTYTSKEERLMHVLRKIEEYYGLEDVFRIADVQEHLYVENNGQATIDTVIKTPVAAIKDRQKIYLDRASLNLGKVNISAATAKITKFDVLVIMLNINTIASGLAKILYNTVDRTVDHYNKVERISKEIALLLAAL